MGGWGRQVSLFLAALRTGLGEDAGGGRMRRWTAGAGYCPSACLPVGMHCPPARAFGRHYYAHDRGWRFCLLYADSTLQA